MTQSFFSTQYPIIFVILITVFLIYKDRSFDTAMRIKFYSSLLVSILLIAFGTEGGLTGVLPTDPVLISAISRTILCPAILLFWISIFLHGRKKKLMRVLWATGIVNAGLCLTSFWTDLYFAYDRIHGYQACLPGHLSRLLFITYLLILTFLAFAYSETSDSIEQLIILLILMAIVLGAYLEYCYSSVPLTIDMLAMGTCVYYYYMIMLMYKRDALTRLMNRHNMNYDLEELREKTYCLSMVDVDNFKNINDKYGHQKGDEALVTVVKIMKAHLLPGCRLYRYGGDEFAVLSRKNTVPQLEEMFVAINAHLEDFDYRISYGTATHAPGEHELATIEAADQLMYEKKRFVKSQDIWDAMTGLFNLKGFVEEVTLMKKQVLVEGRNIGLVSLDIEHLNNINRAYGYTEGNMVITKLAELISGVLEEKEFAGHVGSDEFIVAIKTGQMDETPLKAFQEKLRLAIDNCSDFAGKEYSVELNIASQIVQIDGDTVMEGEVNSLLQRKTAEKESKRKTGFGVSPFKEANIEVNQEEQALVADIIDRNRLRYALQPIVSARNGEIVAYEALMRSDTEPMVSPLTILRHAENLGRSYDVERLTFFNVMERIATDSSIPKETKIFINSIPGYFLKDEDFRALTTKYPNLLERVVLEITEQSELDDQALSTIKSRQKEELFQIAIDDFGSGSSNTYNLLRYGADIIKLDRLLISDIDTNTKKQYFANSIITFARENGIQVLAEGVETEAELKMMIRLRVDYIQGYYTAKPSFAVIENIEDTIRKQIASENIRDGSETKRKIFVASMNGDYSLVQLVLQEYTSITVSADYLKLIGSVSFSADMHIKIKDGLKCTMTLRDVNLNGSQGLPCIELGEGSGLTLIIEGKCILEQGGIRVPEGTSFALKGRGDLTIDAKGRACYGIGCEENEGIGNIVLSNSGKVIVKVDGEQAVAIGGGLYRTGLGIETESCSLEIVVTSVDGIGIGCYRGDVPIKCTDTMLNVDFRVKNGTAIGSRNGMQNVEMVNSTLIMEGSGSQISVLGCNNPSGGSIRLYEGSLTATFSGQEVNLIGVNSGELEVSARHAKLFLKCEGDRILGIGSADLGATLLLEETALNMTINAARPLTFGAPDERIALNNCIPALYINL
ncbi:MAG: GGDEF and EAL domain-containing protein [Acetatifactor sp.]